jgi:hypothetical protein
MRRYWREKPPRSLLHGAELPRLASGVVMLVLIYMLYQWAREPGAWTWLAGNAEKPSADAPNALEVPDSPNPPISPEQPERPATPTLPEAAGFTDEDPEQLDAAREEFQVLTDGRLKLGAEEMVPYNRVVQWVEHQSFERLRQRARSDLLFTHYHDEPDQYRGQLVTMEMSARRILDAGMSGDGVPLHEVWGVTSESINRLYVAIVVGLPKDIPVGPNVQVRVRFAGYFLKLQGYHSYGAKAGAPPERSPLLIGRIERVPVVASTRDTTQELKWGSIVLAVIVGIWFVQFLYFKRRRKKTIPRSTARVDSEGKAVSIEAWLEQSNRSEDDVES